MWNLCSLNLEETTSGANSQTRFPPRWLSWNGHQHLQDTITQTWFWAFFLQRELFRVMLVQRLPSTSTRTNRASTNIANTTRLRAHLTTCVSENSTKPKPHNFILLPQQWCWYLVFFWPWNQTLANMCQNWQQSDRCVWCPVQQYEGTNCGKISTKVVDGFTIHMYLGTRHADNVTFWAI